jgi:hypothetical protein
MGAVDLLRDRDALASGGFGVVDPAAESGGEGGARERPAELVRLTRVLGQLEVLVHVPLLEIPVPRPAFELADVSQEVRHTSLLARLVRFAIGAFESSPRSLEVVAVLEQARPPAICQVRPLENLTVQRERLGYELQVYALTEVEPGFDERFERPRVQSRSRRVEP